MYLDMETRITKLLGCKYPMIQGGMAWIAESTLASAVSNAGAVGLIAGGSAPIDYLREQIRTCKEKTQNPFGVNIMLMSPNADDLAQLVIDEHVPIVTTGAGNPGKYMDAWKAAGIKVIPVVPSVALAKRMERAGADAVVAEGTESGGHIGMNTTMCLVPQVVDAVLQLRLHLVDVYLGQFVMHKPYASLFSEMALFYHGQRKGARGLTASGFHRSP